MGSGSGSMQRPRPTQQCLAGPATRQARQPASTIASSLGSAFGVAISATIYIVAQHVLPSLVPQIFLGRQANVSMRFGGELGLLFNVLMCLVAVISIIVGVANRPEEQRSGRPQVPATAQLGS